MSLPKIFVPANEPEDWKPLLADPKHWRDGYSAKSLAYSWQQANDFPKAVRSVLADCAYSLFQDVELLIVLPEWKVSLPGGRRHSQNDIFALARGNQQLIAITVEGKALEPFDKVVAEWITNGSRGKHTRLCFLCSELGLKTSEVSHIRYQLLHRTASAIIEAKRFNCQNAMMMVHSFDSPQESFEDYSQFLKLYGIDDTSQNSVQFAREVNGICLYFAWIRDHHPTSQKGG